MLADQPACSPRNPLPGQLFLAPGAAGVGGRHQEAAGNLLAADTEVDYRGSEVSVESILRVLTGGPGGCGGAHGNTRWCGRQAAC